jgi:hypothetical protein
LTAGPTTGEAPSIGPGEADFAQVSAFSAPFSDRPRPLVELQAISQGLDSSQPAKQVKLKKIKPV